MASQAHFLSCDRNLTNHDNESLPTESFQLEDTYKVVTGSLIFFGILPFVLFNFRIFPIGTTIGLMLGALLMVVFQVVTQEEAYQIVGQQKSLAAIYLILGIMIIAHFFEREQILLKILRRMLKPYMKFENYLIRICALSFLLSIFFTGDLCCAILTPILLKFWEVQERPRSELETIVLAVATSANIGSMVTIFSSLHIALISAKTSTWEYEHSRLDMRACIMYLLPISAVIFLANTGFLLVHYRIRNPRKEKSKLVSEPSQSEQEMAGLTARQNNGHINVINAHHFVNGYLKNHDDPSSYDGVYLGPAANQRSDERISIPCQLETIPEDDILEISSQSTSLRDCYDMDSPSPQRNITEVHGEASALESSDSSSDSDDEKDRSRNTDENLHQLNMNYRRSALHSQNLTTIGDSSSSLTQSHNGLRLCKSLGIYRSLKAFSVFDFLPLNSSIEMDNISIGGMFPPSDSIAFLVTVCVLMGSVLGLLMVSSYAIPFNLGLVPLGAAIFAVIADAVLNRRPAHNLIKHADWSVIFLLMAMFVWVQGFSSTHLLHFTWDKLGLRSGSYETATPYTIVVLGVFVLFGTNVIGSVPVTLLVLDLLEPCARQQGLVLYLVVLATLGGNMTLFGSISNIVVVHKGIRVLKYRLTFRSHFLFGFPTSVVNISIGVMLVYGLLQIGVWY